MKTLRIPIIGALVLTMTFLVGCSGEGPTTPNLAADQSGTLKAGNNTVPFHAKVRNTIEIVPPFPPPTINAIFDGSGKSKPFGFFELHSTSQIDITTYPFGQVTTYVFTYRNGDELHATSEGTGIEDAEGNAEFSGTITFAGGTGLFSDVTGTGTYAGTADTVTGEGQFDIDGEVSGFGGPGH